MSLTGVKIGSKDTMTDWGLILLSDLTVGSPSLKENRVNIPGADGSLNLSYSLTNDEPRYNDRKISFRLFASVGDNELTEKRNALAAYCHGREFPLWLPTEEGHYFKGLFSIGDISKYGSGTIPVTVTAHPYVFKNDETEQAITIPVSGEINIVLENEQKKVSPVFITESSNMSIIYKETSYVINAGTTRFSGLLLDAGSNFATVKGQAGDELKITYQEAHI